ncbi:hypothetical protein SAMN05216389_101150 [Oceanobacillus limi]|uniref:Lipoprotein n=1 Tax=Oceanobacillus limi TaxID=930131 RepID=A0A1H9Y2H0_9BACI|nr:hypothetical protein [Oceanobacillus limi]SES63029.1 hypothetical protein SAMN05216389_101150 [Oceanobacillus limi]
MRKLIVWGAVLVCVLSACEHNISDSNIISTAELTERENTILSTTSEKSFVFDFQLDSEYEEISVWIEKYEFGKLVDDELSYISTTAEQDGSIIFTTSQNNNEMGKAFHVGIGSNGGTDTINGIDLNSSGLGEMSSVWGNFQGEKNLDNGEVVLANICYSSDENGMQSLTTNFYDDVEGNMDELEKYDVSYLLKAEFMK